MKMLDNISNRGKGSWVLISTSLFRYITNIITELVNNFFTNLKYLFWCITYAMFSYLFDNGWWQSAKMTTHLVKIFYI